MKEHDWQRFCVLESHELREKSMVNRHDADGVAMLKFAGVGGRGFCERGARGGTRDLLLLLRAITP
jgi:hypothetical protein